MKLKKIIDLEILNNPTVLFETKIMAYEMTLAGYKIGDSIDVFKFTEIKSAWGEACVVITETRTQTGKFISRTESADFSLEKRIDVVKNNSGWLGYGDDFGFHITNRKIDSFSLHSKTVSVFNSFSITQLIEKLGKNTERKELFDEFNGPFTEIINVERQISITWEDGDISGICLGELAGVSY